MHKEEPNVYRLPIHLPDQQQVYFNPDDALDEVVERDSAQSTALTAWFKANTNNLRGLNGKYAREVSYQDFPQNFVFVKKTRQWKPRERGFAIGRMYFASPSSGERFYLRTLLTVIKGAKSFDDIKTVDGIVCATFKEACFKLGLLEDDKEWIDCLEDASTMQTGYTLRTLFATILNECHPTSPLELWDRFKDRICDDLPRRLEREYPNEIISEELIYDFGLFLLNQQLLKFDKTLTDFPPMPLPSLRDWAVLGGNFLLREQLDWDREKLRTDVIANRASFNDEQTQLFDAVMQSYNQQEGKIFFVHAAGGCGKTYVCNTIAAAVRSSEHQDRRVALCVASSGIAALLLDGGRTAHSRFKIPIPCHEDSTCRIKKTSHLYEVLRQTGVIIWDEAPMQHKFAPEALDRTLQDLLGNDSPFGGITVLFGGDFRQTLPIIPKGTKQEIMGAAYCRSFLWRNTQVFFLTENRRLIDSPENAAFAQYLLDVGSGKRTCTDPDGSITLPAGMRCGDTINDLISCIYPNISDPEQRPDQWFSERTILSCKNDDVDNINSDILKTFPGEEKIMQSADSLIMDSPDDLQNAMPVEFLNSITVSGLPLSRLALKVGSPLMLLRNLDPSSGLCNGTRLVLTRIKPRVLECRILSGVGCGNIVLIPRISIEPSAEDIPVKFKRRQFPVRLAFAMTINKSQGQSVANVGLDLRTPVFSHGQLYVALSRCTSESRIKVLFPEHEKGTKTVNIVWPQILTGL